MTSDSQDNSYREKRSLTRQETNDKYITFEEYETEADETEAVVEENNFALSDITNLAQKASGIDPQQSDENSASSFKPEDLYPESTSKLAFFSPRKPYIKIIVGLVITSIVAITLVIFGKAWNNIMSHSIVETPKSIEEPPNFEREQIDNLKANLAFFSCKGISIKSSAK